MTVYLEDATAQREFAAPGWRRSRVAPFAFSIFLLITSVLGGTAMATTQTTEISQAQRLIEEHLLRQFSLPPEKMEIRYLEAIDRRFPAGALQFVANVQGQNDNDYNYLVFEGRVYCGRIKGEFQRFLQDYRYFEKLDMTVMQMVSLYGLLGPKNHLLILYEEDLREYPEYKAFPQARPPELRQGRDRLTLTFYARGLYDLGGPPALWTVTVSPDYRIEVHGDAPLKPQ